MNERMLLIEVEDATARQSARQALRREARRAFAARVAAEFDAIRQALQSAAHLLAGAARLDESGIAGSDKIRRAGEQAAAIVRALQAFGEELPLEPCPVDLNDLVQSMRSGLESLLGENIRICIDLSPDNVAVMADPAQMRQVLLKLASNSREALPAGGTFRIRTQAASTGDPALAGAEDKTFAILEVSDDGPGLDDASWAHLYEPFFTTKTSGRRGLGLAAVHGIVRQSGGRLWADSAPGRGTSFRIYLPQAAAQTTGSAAAASALRP